MVNVEELKYSKDHLWIRQENRQIKIGLTDHAQKELGELIYIDLPEKGTSIKKSEPFGTIESAKIVTDILAPLSGEVIETNNYLTNHPEIINTDPFDKGWLLVIKVHNQDEINTLLSYNDYNTYLEG